MCNSGVVNGNIDLRDKCAKIDVDSILKWVLTVIRNCDHQHQGLWVLWLMSLAGVGLYIIGIKKIKNFLKTVQSMITQSQIPKCYINYCNFAGQTQVESLTCPCPPSYRYLGQGWIISINQVRACVNSVIERPPHCHQPLVRTEHHEIRNIRLINIFFRKKWFVSIIFYPKFFCNSSMQKYDLWFTFKICTLSTYDMKGDLFYCLSSSFPSSQCLSLPWAWSLSAALSSWTVKHPGQRWEYF